MKISFCHSEERSDEESFKNSSLPSEWHRAIYFVVYYSFNKILVIFWFFSRDMLNIYLDHTESFFESLYLRKMFFFRNIKAIFFWQRHYWVEYLSFIFKNPCTTEYYNTPVHCSEFTLDNIILTDNTKWNLPIFSYSV